LALLRKGLPAILLSSLPISGALGITVNWIHQKMILTHLRLCKRLASMPSHQSACSAGFEVYQNFFAQDADFLAWPWPPNHNSFHKMQARLASLLDPNKIGTGIISPDGQFLVIPLISSSEQSSEMRSHSGQSCDIITALSTHLIDASKSFETKSINSFRFQNQTNKTIIFPLGCVISGGKNIVQDRVLTVPASCPPKSTMDFGEALCGNASARINGELENLGALLPVCVTSGNPLIEPNNEVRNPCQHEMARQRDLQRIVEISSRELTNDREILKYLAHTTAFFLQQTEFVTDELKSYLSHQHDQLLSFMSHRFDQWGGEYSANHCSIYGDDPFSINLLSNWYQPLLINEEFKCLLTKSLKKFLMIDLISCEEIHRIFNHVSGVGFVHNLKIFHQHTNYFKHVMIKQLSLQF
jgi:hypothetical protein